MLIAPQGVLNDIFEMYYNSFEIYDNIFQVCVLLTNKTITGNKAIAVVNGFINSHCEYEELLYMY